MTLEHIYETLSYGPAPESDAIAQEWLTERERNFGLFIGGEWRFPEGANTLPSHSPSSGALLAHCVDADAAAVAEAVAAAQAAFPAWAALPAYERARHLYAIARAMQKHARLLAVLESLDNGKPIRETRDLDIPLAIRHFYHHAGWAQLLPHTLAEYEPLGIVGQIIPWNFPLLMLAWKIAPALAAGNTVVIKPAPQTCLSALCFAEILAEAGLPPGVVNIITGGDECGAALVESEGLAKLAFTGSSEVGRRIRQATAGRGLRLTLELGGKSPFLVFEDADQEAAIEGLVDAIWFNQGEVCCAGSRLLVQESVAEPFLARLRERMSTLRLGDSLDKGIDIGALIDPAQRDRIAQLVDEGVANGATLFQPDTPLPATGCYYPPTLLTDVAPSARVCQEEIFGPVLVAMTFRTPAEAVELANNTRYGLAASLWSENLPLVLDVSRQLQAGSVWVNCTNRFDAASGFGGYRESGFGREGGREGLLEYLRPRFLRPHSDGTRFLRPQVTARASYPATPDSAEDEYPPPPSFPAPLGTHACHLPPWTAPASSISVVPSAAPMATTPTPSTMPMAASKAWPAPATARTSAMLSAPPAPRAIGPAIPRTCAPRFSFTSPKTSASAPPNSPIVSPVYWGMPPAPSAKSRSARSASSPSPPMPISSADSSRKPPCVASSPPGTNPSASSASSARSAIRCSPS